MILREVLLVERVAGLVQDAEKRFAEEARVKSCRDAAIAGSESRAEGVRGGVEPPSGEVETERRRRRLREELLTIDRVVALEDGTIGLSTALTDRADQRNEFPGEIGEERPQFGD